MGELSGNPVAVPDGYQSLASLLGLTGSNVRLIEGFLQAQTSGVTLRFGDSTTPPTAAGGLTIAAGGAIGVGPVKESNAAWPLGRIWVRETISSGGATISVLGVTA